MPINVNVLVLIEDCGNALTDHFVVIRHLEALRMCMKTHSELRLPFGIYPNR